MDDANHTIGRRSLLKATGPAAVGGLFSLSGVTSAGAHQSITLRGDQTNPIRLAEVQRERQKAMKQWERNQRNSSAHHFSLYNPEINEGRELVSYNFDLTSDGTPVEHFGYVSTEQRSRRALEERGKAETNAVASDRNEADVEHVHQVADSKREWVHEVNAKAASVSSSDLDFNDWDSISFTNDYVRDRPYGDLNYLFSHRSHPDSHRIQGVSTKLDMVCGYYHMNNGDPGWDEYLNKNGRVEHEWVYVDPADITNEPRESTSGSDSTMNYGFDIGTGGVSGGATYTYTQGAVEVEDDSSPVDTEYGWDIQPTSSNAVEHRADSSPLSVCHLEGDLCSGVYSTKVVEIKLAATFGIPGLFPWQGDEETVTKAASYTYNGSTYCDE